MNARRPISNTEYLDVDPPLSTAKPAPSSPNTWVAGVVVWLVWTVMLAAALRFVDKFGSNVPSWDGWDMVPVLTHHQPVTLHWLWSQHNEHRVPLPRLILIGLHRLTGVNFRTPMFFNVIVIAALAAALILVARRLRGSTSYTDAFFPILVLNCGQAVNLLWGWQVQFYASMALTVIALLFIVQTGTEMRLRTSVPIGLCAILLPLCGANGLVLVPPLALYLSYAAYCHRQTSIPRAPRDSVITISLAVVALVLLVAYLIGWERVPYYGMFPNVWWPAQAAKLAVMGFGPGIAGVRIDLKPAPFWRMPFLLALGLLLLALSLLLSNWKHRQSERLRISGLFAFLVAMGLGAGSVGLARNPFETRYVTLFFPIWCCVYFVFSLYAREPWRRAGTLVLTVIAVTTLWPNTRFGLEYAHNLREHLGGFERDMKAGVPPYKLIYRHGKYLHPHQDIAREYMPMLREARVGYFTFLRENPVFRELSVPLVPRAINGLEWQDGMAVTSSGFAYLEFSIPQPAIVAGVRMKYTYDNARHTAPFLFFYWRGDENQQFAPPRLDGYSPTGDHDLWARPTWGQINDPVTTNVFWVLDTIKDIQINPDRKPGVFKLHELTFLLAEDDPGPVKATH